MNIPLRSICALSISLLLFTEFSFAASVGTQDFSSPGVVEIQMRQEYDKRGRGYILQAKERIETMKRMGGKDIETQQLIVSMDNYLKVLETYHAAKIAGTASTSSVLLASTTVPTTTSATASTIASTSTIIPGKLRRRYRKIQTSPSGSILSDDQFNSSTSSAGNLPKSATKNTAVVIKKKAGTNKLSIAKLDADKVVLTTKPVVAATVVKQPVAVATTTKPIAATPTAKPVAVVVVPAPKPTTSAEPKNTVLQNVLNQAAPVAKVETSFAQVPVQETDSRINEQTLRTTWMKRVNDLRAEQGLPAYTHEWKLDVTAKNRSLTMAKKQMADHKRTPASPYYLYRELEERFADRDVEFSLIRNTTFTENVGWTYLECGKGDCTQQAITNMRYIFDYFVSEKDKSYRAHRETMVHPIFTLMGVGVVYAADQQRLYLTAHYGNTLE